MGRTRQFSSDDLIEIPLRETAILLGKSKTDQEGPPKLLPISQGLIGLISRYKSHAEVKGTVTIAVNRRAEGPKHPPHSWACKILNRLLAQTSFSVANTRFLSHTFRVGAEIDLVESGASLEKIMLPGGWRSRDI